MAKYFSRILAVLLFVFLLSCSKNEEATVPAYIVIDQIDLVTNFVNEGTSNHKITTAWVFANGEAVGAFELPCKVPAILKEGKNNLRIIPGINLNGKASSRAIYEAYEELNIEVNYQKSNSKNADTLFLDSADLVTSYVSNFNVYILEDFDNAGLSLEKTNRSDTTIFKVKNDTLTFKNPQNLNEDNGDAGLLVAHSGAKRAEIAAVDGLQLPFGGSNVFLEMNYKCNAPFAIGVISNNSGSVNQQITYIVNAKEYWNKLYINLVTEISANPNAKDYKVYFSLIHNSSLDTSKVYLDNLKLVYR